MSKSLSDLQLKLNCQLIPRLSVFFHSKSVIRSARVRQQHESKQRSIDKHVNRWIFQAGNKEKLFALIFEGFDLTKLGEPKDG